MEKRTKVLIIIMVVLGVISAGFHFYRSYQARTAPKPRMSVTMGAPKRNVAKANPAQGAAPGGAAAGAPAQQNANGPLEIKTVEAGKEMHYSSPEDFVDNTKLSQADAESYIQLKLDEATKSLDAARSKKDAVAKDRAEKEVALYEQAASLLKTRALTGPNTEYVYSSLGKRDPFMSPFEVPKVYPPIPLDATPLERVPVESIKVEAIVWNRNGFRAMLFTPDGRAYTVKKGVHVGDKGGWITRITENSVYVTEKIRDVLGDVETNRVVLTLHKEAE